MILVLRSKWGLPFFSAKVLPSSLSLESEIIGTARTGLSKRYRVMNSAPRIE